MSNLHELSAYQFDLPRELIAQYPCNPRDESRLMVIDRGSGHISEIVFKEIADYLSAGDQLIFNNTKVIPARLNGRKSSGAKIEIFLSKPRRNGTWEVLGKPAKKLTVGTTIAFGLDFHCHVVDCLDGGGRIVQFDGTIPLKKGLEKYGNIPLPHYIRREDDEQDVESYQTIYAKEPGAVAAPTAGLHFTNDLLKRLKEKGINQSSITLHVGLGTFMPVVTDDITKHGMHTEQILIKDTVAQDLNNNKNGRKICVGTTSCRAVESAADENGIISPGDFETEIFIYPGYKFKYMDTLITNFHLPESTLLMLVTAFGGYELIMEAYKKAIKEKYRFFSYGDSMLIL